jgi:uncharacterized protein (TIGR03437 family)
MSKHVLAGLLFALSVNAATAPVITTGDIVNGASFAAGIAPSSWISIFGTNLATDTVTAGSSDLVHGYLPTTLGGATVTINGKPAYLYYVSPTQINLESPADTTSGAVSVAITTSAGTATAVATMSAVQPGLFTYGSYAAAVRASDSTIINGTGAAVTGFSVSASAKPGDVLEFFATGLGATSTPVAPGLVFSGAYQTVGTPSVTIGGVVATVLYCGMVSEGLYQINLTVPSTLSSGTYPVVVSQNNVSSPAAAMLSIAAGSTGNSASATTLTAAPASAYPGSLVVLTATVSPATAAGTVSFYEGNNLLGAAALSGGVATLATHFTNIGTYTLKASYSGSTTFSASISSTLSESVAAGSYSLDLSTYTYTTASMTVTTDATHTVDYRFYQNVVYAANPVDKTYESMNLFVPTAVDGTSVSGKPVLLDINVAGYTSSSTWGSTSFGGPGGGTGSGGTGPGGTPPGGTLPGGGTPPTATASASNAQYAIGKGYVIVEAGCRGRDNQASGTYYGKAPAAMVDLKAAVRFLRYNYSAGNFAGDVDHIIDSGGSAGGALASLLGASGNSSLYEPYLAAIGAADASDNIFAVGAWSPITNLDHADMAYEWEYAALKAGTTTVNSTVSASLQANFQEYQDALALTDKRSTYGILTHNNIDDYILTQYLEPSAAAYLQSLSASSLASYLSSNTWLTWDSASNKASFTFANYVGHIGSRGKGVPAFDSFFDLSSSDATVNTSQTAEVQEFGDSTINARHFTNFSSQYVGDGAISADMQTKVNMMNPMYYILRAISSGDKSGVAKYWYIRDGSIATDTSAMVIVDLMTSLDDLLGTAFVNGYEDWDTGHAVNADPGGFSKWVTAILAAK